MFRFTSVLQRQGGVAISGQHHHQQTLMPQRKIKRNRDSKPKKETRPEKRRWCVVHFLWFFICYIYIHGHFRVETSALRGLQHKYKHTNTITIGALLHKHSAKNRFITHITWIHQNAKLTTKGTEWNEPKWSSFFNHLAFGRLLFLYCDSTSIKHISCEKVVAGAQSVPKYTKPSQKNQNENWNTTGDRLLNFFMFEINLKFTQREKMCTMIDFPTDTIADFVRILR